MPEYSRKGVIRGPSGSSITGIVPTNAYPTCEPSSYVLIGANGESIYERFMNAIGRPDLIGPNYHGNHNRVPRKEEIENAIREWTGKRTPEEVCRVMVEANVPVGRVMNVRDIMENEHVRERGMIERISVPYQPKESADNKSEENGWELDVHRVIPIMENNIPTRWAGPDLGQHNDEVLLGILGLDKPDLEGLKSRGVVGNEYCWDTVKND